MDPERRNSSAGARVLVALLYNIVTNKHVHHLWDRCGSVIFLSAKLCIKSSSTTTLAEAHAMDFARQHSSAPVPKVYMAFELKGHVYIVMERIHGTSLSRGWTLRSEPSKERILRQLRVLVEEWRAIPPPETFGVANVDGGPIFDPRLPTHSFWGPFGTIREFHRELRNGIEEEHLALSSLPGLHQLISFHDQPWPTRVFTHGDLSSLNILCQGDEIVGIVDWETAGWFPGYWEYVTAWNVNPQNSFWQQEVDKFLAPWPHALEMEVIRRKYFGDF